MKKCNKCGFENEDDATFCASCGEEIVSTTNHQPVNQHNSNKKDSSIFSNWGFWIVILVIIGGIVYFINKPNPATYIQASAKEKPFLRTGGSYDMDIDTDGEWEISYCSDWIKAEPIEKGLRITCSVNNSGDNRNGWITLSSGKAHVRIDVYQNGFASYIKIDKSQLHVEKTGGSYTVKVMTDGMDYTVSYPEYCTIFKELGYFRITIPDNNNYSRTGMINVTSDNQITTLSFMQNGICITCGGTGQMNCNNCGGTGQVISSFNMFGGMNYEQCSTCNGTGKLECTSCGGTGIQ